MPQNMPVTLNESAQRFELTLENHTAYVEFEKFPGGMALTHTIVPQQLGGRGVGGALVKQALDYAVQNHLKIRPVCTFVQAYLDKHPQYQAIVDDRT